MTLKEKIIFLAAVPLVAAGIGASANYLAAPESRPIVITEQAVKSAKDGKLVIEIVDKNNDGVAWPVAFAFAAFMAAYAFIMWTASRD